MKKISRSLLPVLMMTVLASCGWHLRGSQDHTEISRKIYLTSFDSYGDSHEILHRKLGKAGALAESRSEADYTLKLIRENLESNTLSITDNNNAAEFELILKIDYRIENDLGEAVSNDSISSSRHYQFNRNRVIAKEKEEKKLLEEMRDDIAENLMRRLAHLPPSQD